MIKSLEQGWAWDGTASPKDFCPRDLSPKTQNPKYEIFLISNLPFLSCDSFQ